MRVLLLLGALLIAVAYLAGAFSLRQPVVVALDMGLTGLRFLGVLLVLFWMQEAFAKDIDRRTITFALAYPAPRASYVLGRFLGVMGLVVLTVAIWGLLLYIMGKYADWGYDQTSKNFLNAGYLLVLLGIIVDMFVVGAFFLLVASLAETPILPFLAGFGFAVAARSLGVMLDYLSLSPWADQDMKSAMLPVLDKLRWLLPDLSRLDWRQITLYDMWPSVSDVFQGLGVAIGYALIMLGGAVLLYRRREFS
jgi:Cu-processing system permease protein